ncbi:hypothetical protein ACFLZO_00190 [Patescibacteria group bacterium]
MSQSTIELDRQELLDMITEFEDHNTNDAFKTILLSAIVQSQLSGRPELCQYPRGADERYREYFRESLSFTLCVTCGIAVSTIRRWIRMGNPHYSVRWGAVRQIAFYIRRDEYPEAWERELDRYHKIVPPQETDHEGIDELSLQPHPDLDRSPFGEGIKE